jgi:hypothetical protein
MEWWNIGTLILRESHAFIIVFDLPFKKNLTNNPFFHFTRTQDSIPARAGIFDIPLFQHSNCGAKGS